MAKRPKVAQEFRRIRIQPNHTEPTTKSKFWNKQGTNEEEVKASKRPEISPPSPNQYMKNHK